MAKFLLTLLALIVCSTAILADSVILNEPENSASCAILGELLCKLKCLILGYKDGYCDDHGLCVCVNRIQIK